MYIFELPDRKEGLGPTLSLNSEGTHNWNICVVSRCHSINKTNWSKHAKGRKNKKILFCLLQAAEWAKKPLIASSHPSWSLMCQALQLGNGDIPWSVHHNFRMESDFRNNIELLSNDSACRHIPCICLPESHCTFILQTGSANMRHAARCMLTRSSVLLWTHHYHGLPEMATCTSKTNHCNGNAPQQDLKLGSGRWMHQVTSSIYNRHHFWWPVWNVNHCDGVYKSPWCYKHAILWHIDSDLESPHPPPKTIWSKEQHKERSQEGSVGSKRDHPQQFGKIGQVLWVLFSFVQFCWDLWGYFGSCRYEMGPVAWDPLHHPSPSTKSPPEAQPMRWRHEKCLGDQPQACQCCRTGTLRFVNSVFQFGAWCSCPKEMDFIKSPFIPFIFWCFLEMCFSTESSVNLLINSSARKDMLPNIPQWPVVRWPVSPTGGSTTGDNKLH